MRNSRTEVRSVLSRRLWTTLAWTIAAGSAFFMAGCGAPSLTGQAAASSTSAPAAPAIIGTWVVTVTPSAPGGPFESIILFTRDGSVIEATSKAMTAPTADTSEGLGVWSGTGDTVRMTFEKYRFDALGHYIGRTVIVETDTLTDQGNAYMGKATTTVYDPNGNVLASFPSTSNAKRMSS
jgi:hypothetical protein